MYSYSGIWSIERTLREIFRKLQYPMSLFETTVKRFVQEQQQQQPQRQQQQPISVDDDNIVRSSVPFKDQKSCDDVKKHLNQLNKKIGPRIEPVFTSRKLATQFGAKEKKHTRLQNSRIFCERKRHGKIMFKRKAWSECRNGEGEWGETRKNTTVRYAYIKFVQNYPFFQQREIPIGLILTQPVIKCQSHLIKKI